MSKFTVRFEHRSGDCHEGSFSTYKDAVKAIRDELEGYENWSPEEATLTHPDGTEEEWRVRKVATKQ